MKETIFGRAHSLLSQAFSFSQFVFSGESQLNRDAQTVHSHRLWFCSRKAIVAGLRSLHELR
jgi:hypothetical protein